MKKTVKELRDKTIKELEKEQASLREDIAKSKLSFVVNPQKDTNALSKKKKRLAVILTLMNEKKMIESLKTVKS